MKPDRWNKKYWRETGFDPDVGSNCVFLIEKFNEDMHEYTEASKNLSSKQNKFAQKGDYVQNLV